MKIEILDRIKQLGGNINKVKGISFYDDLMSITFNTVLYQRPIDTPWNDSEDEEPILGLGDFFDENEKLIKKDSKSFCDKVIKKYYQLTDEEYGQMLWDPCFFTPFKEGTEDFAEWNEEFIDGGWADLSEIIKLTNDSSPDFIRLLCSYGFPYEFYICLSDPNPQNPSVFSTENTILFNEVTNEGNLEDFLKTFMTKEELIEIIDKQIEK